MALFRRGSRDVPDYSDKIYAMHLLKRYEIEALEYQERNCGSAPLADDIHGLRNMVDAVPLWLVGQTNGGSWHGWIIAKIDTRDSERAKELYVLGQYDQILPLSYTECIDEWYEKRGRWGNRI